MSIEQALAELTAAVKEQTAFMKSLQKDGPKAAAAAPATAGKPAAAPKATAGKKITLDTVKEKFGAFLGVEDKKVRKTRIDQVKSINEFFGVEKASDLDEDRWAEAIGYLKQFEAGETPDFMNEGGEDDDSGDDSLV